MNAPIQKITHPTGTALITIGSATPVTVKLEPLFIDPAEVHIDRNGLPIALIGRDYDPELGLLTLILKTNKEVKSPHEIYIESRNNPAITIPLEIKTIHTEHLLVEYQKVIELVGSQKYKESEYIFSSDLPIEGFEINTGVDDILAYIVHHQGNRIRVRYYVTNGQNYGVAIIKISHNGTKLLEQCLYFNIR